MKEYLAPQAREVYEKFGPLEFEEFQQPGVFKMEPVKLTTEEIYEG